MSLTRRKFVATASAAAATALTGCRPGTRTSSTAPTLPATLREAGRVSGILAGSAVGVHSLRNDPGLAALMAAQCSIAVTENDMKLRAIRPTMDSFFFDNADYFVGFCERHKIKARGHNFVWHLALPEWFEAQVTAENAEHFLTDHIHRFASRYAGRIHSWDVVNEAIEIDDKLPNGFRNSPWQKVLPGGDMSAKDYVPAYIDVAFRTARAADPKAMLVYNDYGIESEWAKAEEKRAAVLQLLRNMQRRGIPVDAVGIQSHIDASSRNGGGTNHTYGPGVVRFIAEARGMGLKVLITELDVNDKELPAETAVRDAAVGNLYGSYLRQVLADPAVVAMLTWGLTDRATWLNDKRFARKDGLPQRCLPFDKDLVAKPAFAAEMAALEGAVRR